MESSFNNHPSLLFIPAEMAGRNHVAYFDGKRVVLRPAGYFLLLWLIVWGRLRRSGLVFLRDLARLMGNKLVLFQTVHRLREDLEKGLESPGIGKRIIETCGASSYALRVEKTKIDPHLAELVPHIPAELVQLLLGPVEPESNGDTQGDTDN